MSTSRPPTAFIAAALVLLVMPLLIAIGIGTLGLATGLPENDPRVSRVMLAGFAIWILLVLVIVAIFAARLLRRSSRTPES